MARYFFDLHQDGVLHTDEEGVALADPALVRKQAQQTLPSIAGEEIVKDGDTWTCTVLVRDDDGQYIYTAALTYAGAWLRR